MDKILIVDGCSLSATSFYGTVPKDYFNIDNQNPEEVNKVLSSIQKSSTGVHLNAVYLFFNILGKALRHKNFNKLIVTWDVGRDTFRRELYKDYKANRKPTDIELLKQEELIRDLLEAGNIYSIYDERYEADDLIGSFARKFSQDNEVYILSKDKDLLQLIDENVYIWLKTNKSFDMYNESKKDYKKTLSNYYEYTLSDLKLFHQIDNPKYIPDIKGLIGDQGDNIPGIKGIGEKTAIPLINHFKGLEELYLYIENNSKENVNSLFKDLGVNRSPYNKLMEAKDIAFLSRDLGKIVTDIDYIVKLDKNTKLFNLNIDNERWHRECQRLNLYFK